MTTVKLCKDWPAPNQRCYQDFRQWLRAGSYAEHTLHSYSRAVRLALGLLDKLYWQIELTDLDVVRQHITTSVSSASTQAQYGKGLTKFAEYLREQRNQKTPAPAINWAYYIGTLPDTISQDVRRYLAHRRRTWLPERQHRATLETLSHLTRALRWMAAHATLEQSADIMPNLWFDYLDSRLAQDIKPATLNRELWEVQLFLHFLADAEQPVCARMFQVKALPVGMHLPRDIPREPLSKLLTEIAAEAQAERPATRRMGLLDQAWVLLMLYSGLRTGEVRRLLRADLDLPGRQVRVTQSKGLKDRVVPLAPVAVAAIQAYLDVRGPAPSDHVFIYRHQPLSVRYCGQRLRTYGKRCGVQVTPHQLRHTAATLLLNAGVPILTVKAVLGHAHIDTTLNYTRLYDGTVAADYYRAMRAIETHLNLADDDIPAVADIHDPGQLVALLDALHAGTLNPSQRELVQTLRAGILALAERAGGGV